MKLEKYGIKMQGLKNAAGETKLPLPNRANAAASLLPGKDAKKLRAPKKYRRTFWEKEEPT